MVKYAPISSLLDKNIQCDKFSFNIFNDVEVSVGKSTAYEFKIAVISEVWKSMYPI